MIFQNAKVITMDPDRRIINQGAVAVTSKNIVAVGKTREISEEEWKKVYLSIPKRKYKHVKVFEERTELISGRGEFRQSFVI